MLVPAQAYIESAQQLGGFAAFQPLLGGDAGTAQTIQVMRKLVDAAVKDPCVNRFAIDIVRGTPQYDDLAKIEAIYNWVAANFTYVQDPVGPFGAKEAVRPVRDLLALRAGDCDDINGVLFPALLGTLGYSTRLITVAGDPQNPREFSHVYCEVEFHGQWIPMDSARPGARFGEAPPFAYRVKEWPMTDVNQFSLMGRGLAGYVGNLRNRGMGDAITGKDVQAIESGAAQIIGAATGNQNVQEYFSNSGLATAGAPAYAAPNLSYGVTGSLASTNLLPLLLIGGLALLLAMGRR